MDMDNTSNLTLDSPTVEARLDRLELPGSPNDAASSTSGSSPGEKRDLENSGKDADASYQQPHKKQRMESWAFKEPAKVLKAPLVSHKIAFSLDNLSGDARRAEISKMLEQATQMAETVGAIDPEPETLPSGRRRFQRRNSFVIHRNIGASFSGLPTNTSTAGNKLTSNMHNYQASQETGMLGLPKQESKLVMRRMSMPWSPSLDVSNHSTSSRNCPNTWAA